MHPMMRAAFGLTDFVSHSVGDQTNHPQIYYFFSIMQAFAYVVFVFYKALLILNNAIRLNLLTFCVIIYMIMSMFLLKHPA